MSALPVASLTRGPQVLLAPTEPLAGERLLPVHDALVPLLPQGGLRRGSTIAVTGRGAVTSLALALVAQASSAGSWTAVVGLPGLGLVAAHELGVSLDRCALVDHPPPGTWGQVVGALIGAVDVVLWSPPPRLPRSETRRVAARMRERGTVLVQVSGASTGPSPDVTLTVTDVTWQGIERGHGRLAARRVSLERSGRGAAARLLRVDLWLPGPDGRPAAVEPEATVHRFPAALPA